MSRAESQSLHLSVFIPRFQTRWLRLGQISDMAWQVARQMGISCARLSMVSTLVISRPGRKKQRCIGADKEGSLKFLFPPKKSYSFVIGEREYNFKCLIIKLMHTICQESLCEQAWDADRKRSKEPFGYFQVLSGPLSLIGSPLAPYSPTVRQ